METKYDLESTVDASSILALRDNIEATILRLWFAEGEVKWLVSNPQQQTPTAGEVETSQPYAYIGPPMRTESGILSEGDQACIRHGVTEKYYF